jgi:hypothetical protein
MALIISELTEKERGQQTAEVYADIGRIAVYCEHLRDALEKCCVTILRVKGLDETYANMALMGQNMESIRRTWVGLANLHYSLNKISLKIIKHLAKRIENANKKRNDTIHGRWWVEWGNEWADSYRTAAGSRRKREHNEGRVIWTHADTKQHPILYRELKSLWEIISRFDGVIDLGRLPENNFHWRSRTLMPGQPAKK